MDWQQDLWTDMDVNEKYAIRSTQYAGRMKLEVVKLKPGEQVTVGTGPLKGKSGEVIYTKQNRVGVLLESLGMQIRAEVEGVMLEHEA